MRVRKHEELESMRVAKHQDYQHEVINGQSKVG